MFRSLIYKEWLKTGRILAGIVLLLAGFTAYDCLALAKNAELNGFGYLWSFAVEKDSLLVDNLAYLPVVAGLILAIAQFVPETARKRLKLTLHLPYSQTKIISIMQGYGIAILVCLFLLQSLTLALFLSKYLVWDIIARIIFSFLTWYCAGLAAYVWTSAICLEPSWTMRIVETVVMAALLSIFFMSSTVMAYSHSILVLFIVTVVFATLLIHYSVRRFKDGVQ